MTFKARSDQPVHELYRNGIVHGMLTNYDNVIVATKARDRLFAVSDWARSLRELSKEAEKPAPPTLCESLRPLAENKEHRAVLDELVPLSLATGDPELSEHGACKATIEFSETWSRKQWGKMTPLVAHQWDRPVQITQVKSDYNAEQLSEYHIDGLVEQAAVITHVHATLTINGQKFHPALRWIYQDEQGASKIPYLEDGTWRLLWWGVSHMKCDASTNE